MQHWLRRIPVKKILFHLLFWVAVWFFYVYFFGYNSSDREYVLWFSSALLPITMIVTYVMVFLIIPKYLLKKKYFRFALYSFYAMVFAAYMIVLIIYACLIFLLKYQVNSMPPMSKNFVSVFILMFLVVGIVSMINLLNYNFKTISQNKELQNKILSTQLQLKEQELSYLKMQIHPHFLFNTLNTIYGLAIKQSKHTPEIILKLSNLLDYILYHVNKPLVNLNDEVMHIKEYIDLERIRFQETLEVSFSANDVNKDIQIAPMLLIPFVENAFKHGNLIDGSLKVKINIKQEGPRLDFYVRNTVKDNGEQKAQSGIGLDNIKKRLQLHYPDNYKLDVLCREPWYSVNLSINNLKKQNHG